MDESTGSPRFGGHRWGTMAPGPGRPLRGSCPLPSIDALPWRSRL